MSLRRITQTALHRIAAIEGRPSGPTMATKNKAKKIFTGLLWLFVIFFATLAILTILNLPGNYRIFSVQTGSMEPSIKTGSVVFTKKSDSYKIGDVITFQTREERIVTHRITEEVKDGTITSFIVKGDANDAPDSDAVPLYNVIGRVLFAIPFVGFLVSFLKTPLGIVTLVVIPTTILVWEEINKLKQEFRNLKKSNNKPSWWAGFKNRLAIAKKETKKDE